MGRAPVLVALLLSSLAACGEGGAGTPSDPIRAEFEEIARQLEDSDDPYVGRRAVDPLRRALQGPDLTAAQGVLLRAQIVDHLLRLGQVDEAVTIAEAAWALFLRTPELAPALAEVADIRGLAALRHAEVQNCIARPRAACCIVPLEGDGRHADPAPALTALAAYGAILDADPGDRRARWLYNLVAQALGRWPDQVPPDRLIPDAAYGGTDPGVGRFRDVGAETGSDVFSLCGGAAVEDFDGDGLLDVVASNFDPRGGLVFLRNDGRGHFEDRSSAAGVDRQLGGLNVIAADYDGDDDPDLLVLRGAWLHHRGRIRNSLLRNDGGRFTDVTHAAGLATPACPTQTAAFGDFDGDGDLDLYVGNESLHDWGHPGQDLSSQLFLNRGDGTFEDVAVWAGVTNDRFCKGVAAGDYDNDGDLDLYVSNVGGNRLYRNDGGLRFTDVAPDAGVVEPSGRSFATWFFDADDDGWLDLFVAAYDATVEDLASHALGEEDRATRPRLYRNLGDGRFADVAAGWGLDRPLLPMGAGFGDVDDDGRLDVYLATGDPHFDTLMPNVLFRNLGDRFVDVTRSAGLGHLQKGHGVAFADFDHDGDLDLYHELGGFYPGDGFRNALFLNPGHARHSVTLTLRGTRSNRAAFGARIHAHLETDQGPRDLHRAVGSVSSFGGAPPRQHLGLGSARQIARLDVWWPSGRRQTFRNLEAGTHSLITEGQESPVVLPRQRW